MSDWHGPEIHIHQVRLRSTSTRLWAVLNGAQYCAWWSRAEATAHANRVARHRPGARVFVGGPIGIGAIMYRHEECDPVSQVERNPAREAHWLLDRMVVIPSGRLERT